MKPKTLNDFIQLIVLIAMIVTGGLATIVFLFDFQNHLPVSIATDEDLSIAEFNQIGEMIEDYLDEDIEAIAIVKSNRIYFDELMNIQSFSFMAAISIGESYKFYDLTYHDEQIWIRYVRSEIRLNLTPLTFPLMIDVSTSVSNHMSYDTYALWFTDMVYPRASSPDGSASYVWMDGTFVAADMSNLGAFYRVVCYETINGEITDEQTNYFFPLTFD